MVNVELSCIRDVSAAKWDELPDAKFDPNANSPTLSSRHRSRLPAHDAWPQTLPPQLSQLSGLRRLRVRRGLVSEGVLLTEYEALSTLTALTSLALERQEDEAWVLPPELLALTALRHLSIAGNDCS